MLLPSKQYIDVATFFDEACLKKTCREKVVHQNDRAVNLRVVTPTIE